MMKGKSIVGLALVAVFALSVVIESVIAFSIIAASASLNSATVRAYSVLTLATGTEIIIAFAIVLAISILMLCLLTRKVIFETASTKTLLLEWGKLDGPVFFLKITGLKNSGKFINSIFPMVLRKLTYNKPIAAVSLWTHNEQMFRSPLPVGGCAL
jgi:hypothetical protein